MSETDLARTIREAVNALPGCRFWNQPINHQRRKTGIPTGTPDLIGYVGLPLGAALWCAFEIKTPAGLKRKTGATYWAQVAWREQAAGDGARVFVVTSAAEAVQHIREIRQ